MESKQVPARNDGSTPVLRLMAEANARDAFLASQPAVPSRHAPGLSPETGRALTRSGFWSGIGFVGASVVAGGLLRLGSGGASGSSVLLALALVVAGGALATFAWRTAWNTLDSIDASPAAASPAAAIGARPPQAALVSP